MESALGQVVLLHSYPPSYCGESKWVSNKYLEANYTHPLHLRQSFCAPLPLFQPAGAKPRPLVYRTAVLWFSDDCQSRCLKHHLWRSVEIEPSQLIVWFGWLSDLVLEQVEDGSCSALYVHGTCLLCRVFQQVDSAVVCLLQQPHAKPYLQSRGWEPFRRCCEYGVSGPRWYNDHHEGIVRDCTTADFFFLSTFLSMNEIT